VLSEDELAAVGGALCSALGAVHDAGLVHGDVKAQNVLRDGRGHILLGDFGTSQELRDVPEAPAGIRGTPAYLAPEVLRGVPAGPRTDLFSLGMLLYHLATREFPGRRDARSLQVLRPDLSLRLCRAIETALAPDPADRFPSAAAMAAALGLETVRPKRSASQRGLAALAVAAALIGALALSVTGPTGPRTPAARSRVLVAAFDNRTADPLLDGAMEYALMRALSNSGRIALVPRERIDDTLRLMRRDESTPLTAGLAREVAIRDGDVHAVLAGKIERFGGGFLLTADLLDPRDGAILASVSERTQGGVSLGDAAERAAARIRRHIGETPAVERSAPLEMATTASLRALQLYSQAASLLRGEQRSRNPAAAVQLLRAALTLDPEFALAHLALAEALPEVQPFQPLTTEFKSHLELALKFAERSPTAERLLLAGSVAKNLAARTSPAESAGQYQRAAASLEALLVLQPDHVSALRALADVYRRLDRRRDGAALTIRLADVRPASVEAQVAAAWARLETDDLPGALAQVGRARQLDLPPTHVTPVVSAWLEAFPAQLAWLRNDVREASRLTDALASSPAAIAGPRPDLVQLHVLSLYMTLGRLRAAIEFLERLPEPLDRDVRMAMILAESGDRAALGRFLRDRMYDMPTAGSRVGSFWIDAGLLREARLAVTINPTTAYVGQLALAEGRVPDAIDVLGRSLRQGFGIGSPGAGRVTRKLAEALSTVGRTTEAIRVLEDMARPATATGPSSGFEWLKGRYLLARLYSDSGREQEAAAVEGELRRLLALADDNHPLKRQLAAAVPGGK
jgi:tetratricopeptide (TPR) repeat protein